MKKLLLFMVALSFVFSLVPLQSHAAGFAICGAATNDPSTPTINEAQPCGFCHIFALITTVINFFLFPTTQNNGFAVVPLLSGFFLAVAGFFLLIGGENPARLKKGKDILTAVVVGLIIVYGAWVFVGFFLQAFGVAKWTGLGTWWQIPCAT